MQSACPSERGSQHRCTCSFLTDFDDASKVLVEVCSPSPERALAVARGCAQAGAPAPIDACECRPAESGSGDGSGAPCRPGDCRYVSR